MSCVRCSKTHSTVQAFLITCYDCNRKWHHRCHIPPISDQELVERIKAHNAGNHGKGVHGWRCKRCSKIRNGAAGDPVSSPVPSQTELAHSSTSRSVSARSPTHRPVPIPPADATRSFVATKLKKTVHPLAQEEEESSDASRNMSRRAPPSKAVIIESKVGNVEKSLAQEEEESTDSSVQLSSHTRVAPIQTTQVIASRAPPQVSFQQPMRTGDESHVLPIPSDDDLVVLSSRPRKKLATGNSPGSISFSPAPHPSSKRDKEVDLEKYVDDEPRRRKKFAPVEPQNQGTVERITSTVIDLTLESEGVESRPSSHPPQQSVVPTGGERMSAAPTLVEHPISNPVVPDIVHQSTAISTNKRSDAKPTLIPQWLHERPYSNDIWERAAASRGKVSQTTCPPTIAQRKVKVKVRRLGEIQPQLYQFSLGLWINERRDMRLMNI